MHKFLVTALLACLLIACGDKQTATIPASWSPRNHLVYAYPYDGQTLIAPTAPVVLHFADKLSDSTPAALKPHFTLTGPGNPDFTVKTVDEGRGVVLTPTSRLVENASYAVAWSNLASADGNITPVPISFSTRPANKGSRNLVASGSNPAVFVLERSLPVQSSFPLMDFSSLRLQFNQPIDQRTLQYGTGPGTTFSLVDSSNTLVPARIFASNRLLTIDPKDDLVPGQQYTLQLGSGIKSALGDPLTAVSRSFTPLDSNPRATMALEAPASGMVSTLTGEIINKVPIASTLLGNNSASQQSGNLYAELAFVPHYPHTTPLRVKRGNLLSGSAVDVMLVGTVPASLNSGAIRVDIISDANGYMTDNPYSKAVDAPRQVYLTMDVAMSAADSPSNGAFNQNILHVDVVGTAIVKNGKLVMDAVGVVELDVLGLDQAAGVLSFHLEGYQDQNHAPAPAVDSTAPSLQSWVPGDEAARARPGDPVILTFTEPLDPATINAASLRFLKGVIAEPFSWRADGSSIVLQPQTALAHNASYTVELSTDLKDIAGNALDQAYSKTFAMTALASPASRAPVVLAAYPGYPCVSTGAAVTIGSNGPAGTQGRCAGGSGSDDVLPLPDLATDRAIQVQFSQSMNGASITGTTFKVETSSNGSSWTPVPGHLEVAPQALRFSPDAPWIVNRLYRYTLVSNGSGSSSVCNSSTAICGSNGLPLQTQSLAQAAANAPAATGGGPNMVVLFRGVAPTATVLQRLRGLPASDVNASFVHDAGEYGPTDTGGGVFVAVNGSRIITTGQTGLVTGSNIGCAVGSSCPEKQFLYLSNTLDAEVAGYDAVADGVKVLISPTRIVASSVDVYANSAFGTITSATGPQVMRIRYAPNPANGNTRELPVTAYITNHGSGLQLAATLDLYLDEPELAPSLMGIPIAHNLYSYPLTVSVAGPVTFLPDGRMKVALKNTADVNINVSLTALSFLPAGTISLRIPAGTLQMEGVSSPVKP
ncbi:MAG: Ig-like domain-containing protein [bacterium]|nr:Ig-like domain-containing protein [bacterium]